MATHAARVAPGGGARHARPPPRGPSRRHGRPRGGYGPRRHAHAPGDRQRASGERRRSGRGLDLRVELAPAVGRGRARGARELGVKARWVCTALILAACRAAPIPPAQRYPAGTSLTAKYIVVAGTRLRYVESGNGPSVVLIHGFGGSIYGWRRTIEPLAAAGFHVVAFDAKGFGFSDKPAHGYSNGDYARLVLALVDSLHLPDPVLVGHSMGGAIAAEAALRAPDRIRGLVLVDAAGLGTRGALGVRAARWPV